MKKRLCLLLLPFLTLSCSLKEGKPADVISEDTMTNLLLDIHLAEARISRSIQNYDTSRMTYRVYHQNILKKYNLTDSSYKHSYDYYINHPNKMDKIYERILDSLSLKEAGFTVKIPADSTQNQNQDPGLEKLKPTVL